MKGNNSIKSYLKTAIISFLSGHFIYMFIFQNVLLFGDNFLPGAPKELTINHVNSLIQALFQEAMYISICVMFIVVLIKFIINIVKDRKEKIHFKKPDIKTIIFITLLFIILLLPIGLLENMFFDSVSYSCGDEVACTKKIIEWEFPCILIWPTVLFYIIVIYKKCFNKKNIS